MFAPDVISKVRVRPPRICEQFNPDKEAVSAYVGKDGKLRLQFFEAFQNESSDSTRVFLQLFVFDNREDGVSSGCGNGIAAKRVEVLNLIRTLVGEEGKNL